MKTRPTFAALTSVALLGCVVPSASAATPRCTDGKVCVWEDDDYEGSKRSMEYNGNDYSTIFYSNWVGTYSDKPLNDSITSVRNQGLSCDVYFYEHAYHKGASIKFDRVNEGFNYQDPYLKNGGGSGSSSGQNWNDRISSHRWGNC